MRFLLSAVALFGLGLTACRNAPLPDIEGVASQAPCQFAPFEEQSGFTRRFYTKAEYEAAKVDSSIECLKIQYLSDGLKVVGFIVKPRHTQGKRYPVIVYNRGGFLEISKVEAWNLLDFYSFATRGFVVLASQYRGNDGGEGHEEVGGADVDDVINLAGLSARLPYTDAGNIFMYGQSRGGMMTFLALKRGVAINAAAVVGAVFDAEAFLQRSPRVLELVRQLIPEYAASGASILQERSAMNWPEKLGAPVLIIHGANDREVPASEALTFVQKLAALRKPYELIVYEGDGHEAARNRHDRDSKIAAWFNRYKH